MTINPFEILKNAQNVQKQFGQIQEEMKTITAVGSSGGGIVKVTLNGQLDMTAIEIDPVAVDRKDIPMLQDLIIAAHADALVKTREAITAKLGPLVGGLSVPGMGI